MPWADLARRVRFNGRYGGAGDECGFAETDSPMETDGYATRDEDRAARD